MTVKICENKTVEQVDKGIIKAAGTAFSAWNIIALWDTVCVMW